jgi:hypothetical protein
VGPVPAQRADDRGPGPSVTLLPEPVAAAAHFWSLPDRQLTPGSSLAVYDLGGGTFDCAVVGSTPNGFVVLAEAGLATVGGVDFDQAVIDHVGRTVSGQDPARWQALVRPRNAADRRAARTLREDVRAAKETLSRYAQTDLSLPDPFDDTLLTRREFEGLVRPVLAQTVELLSGTIARAGLAADQLGGIYLVGGSSRIPLVATMISEQLRVVPTTLDQPETAVAMGAALLPVESSQQGRTDVGAGGAPTRSSGPVPTPRMAAPAHQPADGPVTRQLPAVPGAAGPVGGGRQRRTGVVVAAVTVAVLAIAAVAVILARSGSGADPTDIADRSTGSSAATVGISSTAGISTSPSGLPSRSSTVTSPATTLTSSSRTSTPPTSRSSTSRSSTSRTSTSRSSTSRTSAAPPPDGCADPNAKTGLTGCMKQLIGQMAELSCSKNPSAIGLDATALKQLQTLTSGFSTCIDSSRGFAAVIFQAKDTAGRDALGPAVRLQFTANRSGQWKAAGRSGQYSVGRTATGISLLEWEDDDLPIVAFIGATKGASADDTVDYWKSALEATITG